ncbi:hypothetical protein GCM10010967_46650 [Dyadobacter beijingensis]|uniref:Uncharacterized protein n=1 Tax=Dyadobacter beijingensis TaxID=365489 RepID=A0ABQ2IEG5_9BACT|nr:hypothetical protein GCM10010967_46650 [Dyadobacter beijingensis]
MAAKIIGRRKPWRLKTRKINGLSTILVKRLIDKIVPIQMIGTWILGAFTGKNEYKNASPISANVKLNDAYIGNFNSSICFCILG